MPHGTKIDRTGNLLAQLARKLFACDNGFLTMTPDGSLAAKPFIHHRDYKRSVGSTAAAWFKAKGLAVSPKYPYCLESRDKWADNIIVPEVAEFVEYECKVRNARRRGFPLHKYIHHGLSSQAMLFNLVGPLIVREDLEPLHSALAEAGVPWPAGTVKASLEIEDRLIFKEERGQPTSIDLVLKGEAPPALFIEAKFVEQNFGGCSVFENGDCSGFNPARRPSSCYLHRIGRTYWEMLQQLGFLRPAMTDGPICPLANYYQFFREIVFALAKGGEFVLLFDRRSPVFYRPVDEADTGLMAFLSTLVPKKHMCHVHAISIQEVAASIRRSGRHNTWIGDFEEKYGL